MQGILQMQQHERLSCQEACRKVLRGSIHAYCYLWRRAQPPKITITICNHINFLESYIEITSSPWKLNLLKPCYVWLELPLYIFCMVPTSIMGTYLEQCFFGFGGLAFQGFSHFGCCRLQALHCTKVKKCGIGVSNCKNLFIFYGNQCF